MLRLAPRLKLHATRCDIGGAPVVAQLIDQGFSILDLPDSNLVLLKCCDGREDEVLLWHRPISVCSRGALEGRLRAGHRDSAEVDPRHSLGRSAAALELSIQHIHYASSYACAINRERYLA